MKSEVLGDVVICYPRSWEGAVAWIGLARRTGAMGLVIWMDGERRVDGDRPREGCPLTARELEVVALVARGLGNAAVAEELGLSPLTIKSHLARICRGLGIKGDRSGLVGLCIRQGWI